MSLRSKASGPAAKQYRCSACTRSFVGFGDVSTGNIVCVCGAELLPRSLAFGVYELLSSEPKPRRAAKPERSHAHSKIPQEADLGYGESHGYGPAHGGPTGPGDAPASGEAVASVGPT